MTNHKEKSKKKDLREVNKFSLLDKQGETDKQKKLKKN